MKARKDILEYAMPPLYACCLMFLFSYGPGRGEQEPFSLEEEALSRESAVEEEAQDWGASFLADVAFPSQYVLPTPDLGFPEISDPGVEDLKDGYALYRKGEYPSAIKKLRRAASRSLFLSSYTQYYEMLSCLGAGDTKTALDVYRSICSSQAEPDLSIRAGMEIIRSGVGCPDTFCLELIEKFLGKTRDPELLFLAARKYQASGQTEKSASCCLDLFRKYPSSPLSDSALVLYRSLPGTAGADPDKQYQLCRFLHTRRQFKACVDLAQKNAGLPGPLRKKFLSLCGHSLYSLRQFEKSLSFFRRLVKEEGPTAGSTLYIARCLGRLKKNNQSREKYLEYLALYPKSRTCENILWDLARTHEENSEYTEAIPFYARIYRQYGEGRMAGKAYFKHAYCLYKKGLKDSAAAVFSRHRERFSGDVETSASLYWAGRIHESAGERDSAVRWFTKAIENNSLCFYASRSREKLLLLKSDSTLARLDARPHSAPGEYFKSLKSYRAEYPQRFKPGTAAAFRRGLILLRCGIYDFARRELKAAEKAAGADFFFQYRLIKAYETQGFFRDAHRLARNLIVKLPSEDYLKIPDEVMKTFYPRYFGEVVDAECRRWGMDPLLIHALIRQESVYNPSIVSFAGAIGLMQLMPFTAKDEARQLKINYADDSLYSPVYNIRVGVHHVDGLMQRLSQNPELMFCAYNAGSDAARKWMKENKGLEYDDFIEEIGYTETRGYVQKCMHNYWQYRKYWPLR